MLFHDDAEQYENIENYEHNRGWFWSNFLINAAELCQDKEYIKAKYHPEKGKPKVDKNDQTEKRMEVLEV